MLTPEQATWLREFRRDALANIASPWLATLYTAIAAVESGYGEHVIAGVAGINEIGYGAVPNRPSIDSTESATGRLVSFRAFTCRAQELQALEYLAHNSKLYVAARSAFVHKFLQVYTDLADVLQYRQIFNQLANDNITPIVYPLPEI